MLDNQFDLEDKIKGGLFGVAIGDALGCAVEFMHPSEIKKRFGVVNQILGGGPFDFVKGSVTDDTNMTLCVLKGIFKDPYSPVYHIGEEFVQWYESRPKDIGNTVRLAIETFLCCDDWEQASEKTDDLLGGNSAGNGSLMRTLPLALVYSRSSDVMKWTKLQSQMTHWDYEATEACLLYNRIAFRILRGETLKDALTEEIQETRYVTNLFEAPLFPPDGYVFHTFSWVIYLLMHTNSFEEVVVKATNLGYDSDTTAAIAGGLAGLYYGFSQIPTRFVQDLSISEELESYIPKILSVRTNL